MWDLREMEESDDTDVTLVDDLGGGGDLSNSSSESND
jgi:hypothetical protein